MASAARAKNVGMTVRRRTVMLKALGTWRIQEENRRTAGTGTRWDWMMDVGTMQRLTWAGGTGGAGGLEEADSELTRAAQRRIGEENER